jgi:hypothetical protein
MQHLVKNMEMRGVERKLEKERLLKKRLEESASCGKCNESFRHDEKFDKSCDDMRQ